MCKNTTTSSPKDITALPTLSCPDYSEQSDTTRLLTNFHSDSFRGKIHKLENNIMMCINAARSVLDLMRPKVEATSKEIDSTNGFIRLQPLFRGYIREAKDALRRHFTGSLLR